MKNLLKVFSLICVSALVVISSQADTALPYKITGEFVYIETSVEEDSSEGEAIAPESPPREPVDLSNATLIISYETTNEEGDAETITLFEGPYEEDFESVGEVAEPTRIKISLQTTEDRDPMTIHTVIGTGSDIQFAYVDRPEESDQFLLAGVTNQVLNAENKFSVIGDLSFLGADLTDTTSVEVFAEVFNEEGNRQVKKWGPVLVRDNTFLIEGEIDHPLTAQLYIHGSYNTFGTSRLATIVLEPQSEYLVGKLGNQTYEVRITSDSGFHAALVESWQEEDEYVALMEAYVTEFDLFLKRYRAGEPEPDVIEEEGSKSTESETDSDNSIFEVVKPIEGCEDATAQDLDQPQSSPSSPRYYSLHAKTREFRNEKLKEIAEGEGDPMIRYLAIEMDPYHWRDYASRLAALRPLAIELDNDFVAAFVTPKIELNEDALILVQNDDKLVPGQKVPEFTLVNYDGEDVVLYELLAEKDLVLIDFWASWCGPCIADFPELKKLHTAYSDENFEIVGVSIDSTKEDWKGGVDEHELPWINLGEVMGSEGPVARVYGVIAIPKGFLVDSQGCIYKKDIRPAALEKFLVDRYGLDESLVEPDEETDDAADASS